MNCDIFYLSSSVLNMLLFRSIIVNIENVFLWIPVVVIHGRNDKQSILSFENSAGNCPSDISLKVSKFYCYKFGLLCSKAESWSKIYQPTTSLFSLFPLLLTKVYDRTSTVY